MATSKITNGTLSVQTTEATVNTDVVGDVFVKNVQRMGKLIVVSLQFKLATQASYDTKLFDIGVNDIIAANAAFVNDSGEALRVYLSGTGEIRTRTTANRTLNTWFVAQIIAFAR